MPPRMLVVEDDVLQRTMLQHTLRKFFPAAVVTAVANGYAALLAYQNNGADIIILDHRLPDVLGGALIEYLRETGVVTPIILVSGLNTVDGAPVDSQTYFMPKPLGVNALVHTINRLLPPQAIMTSAV